MSQDFEIDGKPGQYYLWLRDYVAQGPKPDYTRLCWLTDEEAQTLRATKIFNDWRAQWPTLEPASANPNSLLAIEEGEHRRPILRLRLPAIEGRRKQVDLEVPNKVEYMRNLRYSPPHQRAQFLETTGLEDLHGILTPCPTPGTGPTPDEEA